MECYNTSEEIFDDVVAVSKEILECYIKRTLVSDGKNINQLKGKIVWAKDLENIAQDCFQKNEIIEYNLMQKSMRDKIGYICKKGRNSIDHKIAIPLVYLVNRFKCSEFETMCIFLCIAGHLDSSFEKAYQIILDNMNYKGPSVDLCIDLYTLDKHERNALIIAEKSRVKIMRIFFNDFINKSKITDLSNPLNMNERIVNFIFNINSNNEYLKKYVTLIWPWDAKNEEPIVKKDIQQKITQYIRNGKEKEIFFLYGSLGSGRHFQLKQFSKHNKVNIIVVDIKKLPSDTTLFDELFEQIYIESMLRNAVIAFENYSEETNHELFKKYENQIYGRIWEFSQSIFVLTEDSGDHCTNKTINDHAIKINLEDITQDDRIDIWKFYIDNDKQFQGISPEMMAAKFDFTPGSIVKSIRLAKKMCDWNLQQQITERELTDACYQQVKHNLSERATRIDAKYSWKDLVLPEMQKERLIEACNQVYYKHTIYDKWGFGEKNHYGCGISMLFYGPPGTGKTMTAQVIANELNMEIYKVDLSTIMSKYIGETEKNLNVIFNEVKKSNSILFFDEADAIFGKRTEVKDSNDKYANAETAYLLQKMEEYSGIVILATNFMQNFDEAYKRRIKFVIHFQLPDAEQRIQLWKNCIPLNTPISENIDYEFLGRSFELSGSNIKNVVISAAFKAASQNIPINMQHIIISLKNEMEKYGKILSKQDLGEYFYLI